MPDGSLRLRAQAAIRDYTDAERHCELLEVTAAELQARRTSLLDQIADRVKAGAMSDDDTLRAIGELNDINERFFALNEPLEQADAARLRALGQARSVLQDCEHQPSADEP
jgi:hypothetical protein